MYLCHDALGVPSVSSLFHGGTFHCATGTAKGDKSSLEMRGPSSTQISGVMMGNTRALESCRGAGCQHVVQAEQDLPLVFRLVNNEESDNKSCRGFTEPRDKMSGQRPSRDHRHSSSELWSPCCLQQSGAHPLQPELTWAPAGTGLALMAQHTPDPPSSITVSQLCTQSGQAPVQWNVSCLLSQSAQKHRRDPYNPGRQIFGKFSPCVWMLQVWSCQVLITVNGSTCPVSSIHGIALQKQIVFHSDCSYLLCKFFLSSKEIWLMEA